MPANRLVALGMLLCTGCKDGLIKLVGVALTVNPQLVDGSVCNQHGLISVLSMTSSLSFKGASQAGTPSVILPTDCESVPS